MGKSIRLLFVLACALSSLLSACSDSAPPSAEAIRVRDSAAVMTTYGVSKLISDSGLIRYKVVAEEWRIYDRTNPPRHSFPKGLLLERFDQKFHIEMFVTADTAYWYNQNLWELRGRVKVWNMDGTVFTSQLLYWDMKTHEFYSNVYSHLITPDREVEGTSFRSDEQMRHYVINNSRAVFPIPSEANDETADSIKTAEQNETPDPAAVMPARSPQKSASSPSASNLPQGGHFK